MSSSDCKYSLLAETLGTAQGADCIASTAYIAETLGTDQGAA